MNLPLPILDLLAPAVPLSHLDDLWFQVGGTLCNLECRHCFITCGPTNHRFGFLSFATIRRYLEESVPLGVKEYYFTGGEPFLNPDIVPVLETTLNYGPATVLTNGTVLRDDWLRRLRWAEDASRYSLEFRVSIDGFNAGHNDAIRGEGTFDRAMRGVQQLLAHGFLPVITAAHVESDADSDGLFHGFVDVLRRHGYDRPRVKILPVLRLGAEVDRGRGYHDHERVTSEMMEGFEQSLLLCDHSRMVTDRGVYVCPILVDAEDARLGETLHEAASSYGLKHHACFTCYQYGTICANPSSGLRDS
jgi:molybdenum cofactor biosynthesis enzyme MoaA